MAGAQVSERLQQQRRLADPRIAADQHHRALDQPAAQGAVELVDAGRHPVQFLGRHLAEHLHVLGGRQRGVAVAGRRAVRLDALDQGVPGMTGRALAQPLGADAAAFAADVAGAKLRHQAAASTRTRAASAHISS
jgi:hypothetical protein